MAKGEDTLKKNQDNSISTDISHTILQEEKNSSNSSFLENIYEKITAVIGGDNPDQYFCMNFPGTIINPEVSKYDQKKGKPEHIEANESKLVNKLFDPCFITASDNGRKLQNQYRTALNMLSPKFNRDLFEMKIRLREVLMTPYEYDFGDGTNNTMTLEQVFYRLYNEYVTAKTEWNQMQIDKKAELKRNIIDPNERNDAYLEWYGLVAESEKVKLEEKLGKVLNVFSPGDMNIINAILNCGVGGELESARVAMDMVERLSPDGGYVYPVNLQPSNWYELLDTSFTGVDFLESPAALSQKLKNLQMQRNNIILNINKLTATIPDRTEVLDLRKAYEDSEKKLQELVNKCTDTALNWCEENNKLQLKKLLEPLKTQLDSINIEIEELKEKIAISKAVLVNEQQDNMADIMPNKETEGFKQIIITSDMSAVNTKSSKGSSASNSSCGAAFFLGGYSSNKAHQEAIENFMSSEIKTSIQISMNLAKVQTELDWFDPGVFLLTNSMYNFSENKISPDISTSFTGNNMDDVQKCFEEMTKYTFPFYPVAYVIAKDVVIRFSCEAGMSPAFTKTIEDHVAQGGGLLIFSGNNSSASHSSQSAAMVNSTADSVTVCFTAPQILGYYMQATPADKSEHINSTSDNDMSIISFVSKFKEMIEDFNRGIREDRNAAMDITGDN